MNKAEQNAQDFARAMALLRQGRVADAIPIYEAVLRREPKNIGALNLLGVSLMQIGRLEDAIIAIKRALSIDPDQGPAHYNLGTILHGLGRYEEAVNHFEQAIRLDPNDAQAQNNLGAALKASSRMEEALTAYRAAVRLQPDFFEAHLNVGNTLHALGKSHEALESVDRAIKLQPARQEAYLAAAIIMIVLGLNDQAIPHLRQAIHLGSNSAGTFFRLAICLRAIKKNEEALKVAEEGFKRNPESAEDYSLIGGFLRQTNRNEQAIPYYRKALELNANLEAARLGLANSLSVLDRVDEARQHYEELEKGTSISKNGPYNKALMDLSLGRFREGWEGYEARSLSEIGTLQPRQYSYPLWDGSHVETLFIWGEQGLGDEIVYTSILEDAQRRANKIILETDPRLVPLMARSFPQIQVIARDMDQLTKERVSASAHLPIGSLGKLFRLDWQDFPRRPYLLPSVERAEKLRARIGETGKAIIGLSWRSANPRLGEAKSADICDFHPLLRQPGFGFVDLQYGDTAKELDACREKTGVSVTHLDEVDNMNDIDGLAALIEACDAVVTTSNTTAHIAGALGKPVWVLVPHGHGKFWYWFRDRTDSPWYPGARIVRQQPGQSWAALITSITPEIVGFANDLRK